MSSWLSLMFEAGMAALMAALIVYCVKLNKRLSLLRSQDSELKELITGFREASERADLSVQRLKAAGLAAERSLRGAIQDAAVAQAQLAHVSPPPASGAAAETPRDKTPRDKTPRDKAPRDKAPSGGARSATSAVAGKANRAERDMLMAGAPTPEPPAPASPNQNRPKTREEAEESVIQAIRSARGEA